MGVGTLGVAGEVGGGGGDWDAEAGDYGSGDGRGGDAEGYVAGVGGDAEGEAGAGADDDGEGARPEALGEAVEGEVAVAGEGVGFGGFGEEEGEGLVAGALLDVVDAVDGGEVDGVDGEAVEGVCGESDDIADGEGLGDKLDEGGLGVAGVDGEDFCRQGGGAPGCVIRITRLGGWGGE